MSTNTDRELLELAAKPTQCKVCGSTQLTWQTAIVNRSNVQQGRLNTNEVECLFFLGCDHCSETLATVSADKVAGLMNATRAANLGAAAEIGREMT